MNLTMLNSGIAVLSAAADNRQRLSLPTFRLGSATNYTPGLTQTMLQGTELYRGNVTATSVYADTVVFSLELPAELAVSYGEIAIYDVADKLVALGVASSAISKPAGAASMLTVMLTYPGLGVQTTLRTTAVQLSRVKPDFDDIVLQLQSALINKEAWSSLLPIDTGRTVVELLAAVAEDNEYSIESAYQENFFELAKLESSVYAKSKDLGVRLSRKLPASCSVTLSRPMAGLSVVIPSYSVFASDKGTELFNREEVVFGVNDFSKTFTLYAGTVIRKTYNGLGTDFQRFVSEEDAFTVSDTDVIVRFNGVTVPLTTKGLWNFPRASAVQDSTTSKGALILTFGNKTYGTKPSTNGILEFTYVVTTGEDSNDASFQNQKLFWAEDKTFTGVATTPLSGGANELPANVYRRISPLMFASQEAVVTKDEYNALPLKYPGVFDAKVLAQRDLAPMDKNWFNVGKVILLTASPWSTQQKADFEKWFEARSLYPMRYLVLTGGSGVEPKQRVINVAAKVYCTSDSNLTLIRSEVEGAVRKYFSPRMGLLSMDVAISDIYAVIRDTDRARIDYVQLTSPTSDVSTDLKTPSFISFSTSTSGSLVAGNYRYYVTSRDADGESSGLPLFGIETDPAGGSVTMRVSPVRGATGYSVYGRDPSGSVGLLYTTPSASITVGSDEIVITDDGTVTPNTSLQPPSINTSGVHYPVLGTLSVEVYYSARKDNVVQSLDGGLS